MEKKIMIKTTVLERGKATPLYGLLKSNKETLIVLKENQDRGTIQAFYESVDPDKLLGTVNGTPEELEEIKTLLAYDISCKAEDVDESSWTIKATLKTLTDETKKVTAEGVTLTPEMEAIVSEGIMTEENLKKRLEICQDHGISRKTFLKIVDDLRKRGVKGEEVSPLKTAYVNTETKATKNPIRAFFNAVGNCLTRAAFILEGPKSVGKNVFCETLAFLFNMEYFVIQLNENTSDGDVYGEKSTDNSAANKITYEMAFAKITCDTLLAKGQTPDEATMKLAAEFEQLKSLASSVKIVQALGVWVQWLQRGGIMVLNEMDMADANFFSQLVNMILDGTGFMTVPGFGRVDVNPNCILIGTQNGSEYAGTNGQNAASISRFDKYILPQPLECLPALKSACKGQNIKVDDKYLIACNEFYKDLVKKTNAEGFQGVLSDTCLNIRGMVRALKAVEVFDGEVELKERLKISVVNACPENERLLIIQSLNEKVAC